MKVAVFADAFPKLSETFVLSQVLHFANLGHDVTVVCRAADTTQAIDRAGLSHVRILEWPAARWHARTSLPWRLRNGLARLANRRFLKSLRNQDIFLAHFGWQGAGLVGLAGGKPAAPLVTIYHGRDVSHEYQSNGLTRYAALFRAGTLHLTVNRPFAELLEGAGAPAERVAVHHLGVPVADYRFQPADWSAPVRMISLCRLVEKKGVEVALEAAAELLAQRPELDWHYEIAGSGPLEEHLRTRAAELGLGERVSFVGALEHAEALRRIGAAHVLLAPSVTGEDGDQEGIPVTLMEAMALGTIVCSTRHSGIPELIHHGASGLLADEHDVAGLRDNLLKLLDGTCDRDAMASAARAKVATDFDQQTRNAALLARFEEIRAPRAARSPAKVLPRRPAERRS
ncbi:glycosyltransferase [Pseudoroseicyclus tamaricis]|uniref:Glycosyltransferase n=1 Tax=Pseudoroseicyclus tamaricis TaxID=2705421 RepID=A0A6B2JTR5_9RHOB|nr:glycosyltransferase [Pseudoroseicyclus tamaricis]NDV01355.1 glycosyltransferase [Pseudoroseicyclus tamaricis]